MKVKLVAAAIALAACAVGASAQEVPSIPLTFAATGANTSQVTFDRTVSGFFLDTFVFTPSSFTGDVSVSLMPTGGTISFFSALLNGQGFSYLPELGNPNFEFMATVTADTPLTLQVLGFGGAAESLFDGAGSYRGTITATSAVSAVPEPETYALMLAGIGVLAWFRARSRPSRARA